jgi:RNA polymerase sigma factor (TIGR02999 family)
LLLVFTIGRAICHPRLRRYPSYSSARPASSEELGMCPEAGDNAALMTVDLSLALARAQQGDRRAVDSLFAATYHDLRKLARARLRRSGRDAILDTTSLVHESYLRLLDVGQLRLRDRLHFLSYASHAMRSVIVDLIRKRQAERHGGGALQVTLTAELASDPPAGEREILLIHEALEKLAALDGRLAQTVEMRYFGGMTEAEIAEVLGITDRTVRRDLTKARLLLRATLE